MALESRQEDSAVHRLYDASNKISAKSGSDYRNQCADAGVPVPETVLDANWINRGALNAPLLSPSLEAELWTWETDAGICMALPRWTSADEAQFFGLICFGYETGNTCFWDNKKNEFLGRYQVHSIGALVGGAALKENDQGVCSNCHAGENPFVVKIDEPAFAGLWGISAEAWPTPIVHEDWVGNPGPISSLGPVPFWQGKCTECHNEVEGMRFPLLLEEFSDGAKTYCNTVLANTIEKGPEAPDAWMPPSGVTNPKMGVHADRLWEYCERKPASGYGGEKPYDPPPTSVLSPLALGPYYECARKVSVRGAVVGATVELWTSYQGPFSAVATDSLVEFELDDPLENQEFVYAAQTLDGVTSPHASERAYEYLNVLPSPNLMFTPLYECAASVVVETVPGVVLDVEHRRNGQVVQNVKVDASSEYTFVELPGGDFEAGDEVLARQTNCAETRQSGMVVVGAFAGDMPTPNIGLVREGQTQIVLRPLLQGAGVELVHDVQGVLRSIHSNPSIGGVLDLLIASEVNEPLSAGDKLGLTHRLCWDDLVLVDTEVVACDPATLAPEVLPAFDGDSFVVIDNGIPGARVDVFDASKVHIASGSGPEVNLTRKLTQGEKVSVTQALPGCEPTSAFVLTVL